MITRVEFERKTDPLGTTGGKRRRPSDGKEAKNITFLKNDKNIRHMFEMLIKDVGYEELGEHVIKPLEGIKIAGYVGESFENPMYLDKLINTMGTEACETYEKKVSCCGGAPTYSEPEKSQALPGVPDERQTWPSSKCRRCTTRH